MPINWILGINPNIGGFSRSTGFTTSFIAELWALRDGLTLCNNLHFNVVDIQIDVKAIVDLLTNPYILISLPCQMLMTAGN